MECYIILEVFFATDPVIQIRALDQTGSNQASDTINLSKEAN